MRTLIRTDDLPAGERFAGWRDLALGLPVPVLVRTDQPADFAAHLQAADLGAVNALALRSRGHYEFERTPALIRHSDPGAYRLVLGIRGESGVTAGDDEVPLRARDLLLLNTSCPFRGWRGTGDDTAECIMLTLPRALISLPPKMVNRLLGARLASPTGIGALVSDFLRQAVQAPEDYRQSDRARLATPIADLLTVFIANELEAGSSAPPEARHSTLMLQIHDFIQRHLSNQELSPGLIAAAHHISIRHLHKQFSAQGQTVSAFIRMRRLEASRRDLADPLLCDVPVHAIAARWGFSSAAHFSRLFRADRGMTPQEYRRQALARQCHSVHTSSTTERQPATTRESCSAIPG